MLCTLCIQRHHPVIQDDTAGCATAVLRKENAVHTVYTGPSSMVPSRERAHKVCQQKSGCYNMTKGTGTTLPEVVEHVADTQVWRRISAVAAPRSSLMILLPRHWSDPG